MYIIIMFFKFEWVKQFSHYRFLHLGVKMDNNNITLNCLIVPIGKLMNIPCIKVMQAITIHKHDKFEDLEAEIKSRLGEPFDQIPQFCQIQSGSVIEKQMDRWGFISNFFTEET